MIFEMIDDFRLSGNIGRIRDTISQIQNENRNVNKNVSFSNQWWRGEVGDTFRTKHEENRNDINQLINHLYDLQGVMYKLQGDIRRANTERRTAKMNVKQK